MKKNLLNNVRKNTMMKLIALMSMAFIGITLEQHYEEDYSANKLTLNN